MYGGTTDLYPTLGHHMFQRPRPVRVHGGPEPEAPWGPARLLTCTARWWATRTCRSWWIRSTEDCRRSALVARLP